MKDRFPVGCELRHGTLRAPVYERVVVGQDLGGALGFCEEIGGRTKRLEELGLPGVEVEGDDLAAGGVGEVDIAAAVGLGAVRGVVEEADDFAPLPLFVFVRVCFRFCAVPCSQKARVVLECEGDVGTEGEVR